MKTTRNKWWWVAGGVTASALLWANRRLFLVNDVTAGGSTAYPDLKPASYNFPAAQVFALAESTARDLPRWRVLSVDRLSNELHAEARSTFPGLLDDVTIRVTPVPGSTESDVVVRSRSRLGPGDLGENARCIRSFYRALDRRVRTAAVVSGAPAPIENPNDRPQDAEDSSVRSDRSASTEEKLRDSVISTADAPSSPDLTSAPEGTPAS